MRSQIVLVAVSLAILVSSALCAEYVDEVYWDIEAVGGEDMTLMSHQHKELTAENDITQNFVVDVEGFKVRNLKAWSAAKYAQSGDESGYSTSAEINQEISLPGYFEIEMFNTHITSNLNQPASQPDLKAGMDVYTLDGQKALSLKVSMSGDLEGAIDEALRQVDQAWYQTYGNQEMGRELRVGLGYKTLYSESTNQVACEWGHEYSTEKIVQF